MDLERIKQNFRIRSGRTKKKRAIPVQSQNSYLLSNGLPAPKALQSKTTEQTPPPQPDEQKEEQKPEEQEEPSEYDASEVEQPAQEQPEMAQDDFNLTAEAHSSEAEDFDLNPPEPRPKPPSLEDISTLLFSSDHLNSLLHQPSQLTRFSAFLQRYVPESHPLLSQYLETQKAIKAVEYANALAEGLKPTGTREDTSTEPRKQAAFLDPSFEHISNASFRALVGDALPAYISYCLVKIVSECLTNEITGRSTPVMRDLIGGLSEVFCLTDPTRQDNPIIYASEEFYRLTRYGPEDTINSNCRFLQGRRTDPDAHLRLRNAIDKGEEVCETLLNYRRDGKPFLNLLMIAPLHDKNGKLKYFLGAQIDVSGLVQGGRALEGFQRFLTRKVAQKRSDEMRGRDQEQVRKMRAWGKLRELSEMFDLEESAIVKEGSRAASLTREDDDNRSIESMERTPRRVFGDEELSEEEETQNWQFGQSGDGRLSGKLPGVYDSFMLIRAAPSLRIVFVSPKLSKMGNVLQTPFLSHVAAPGGTLKGLKGSLLSGLPVSAKIHFMPDRGQNRDGEELKNGTRHEDGPHGRAVWVSLTPLLGVDDRVGVWMCVFVEKAKVGNLQQRRQFQEQFEADQPVDTVETPYNGRRGKQATPSGRASKERQEEASEEDNNENRPIKPVRIHSKTRLKQSDGEKGTQKPVRQVDSVYFDAEGSQEPSITTNHDSNTLQTQNDPDNHRESAAPEEKAVLTPVDEYEPTSSETASYGIGESSASLLDHVNMPQPYAHVSRPYNYETEDLSYQRPTSNSRVLIQEDDDILDDDSQESDSSRGRLRYGRSRSNSPTWSPPSIPSSAQFGSDNGSEPNLDTPTRSRIPGSANLGGDEPGQSSHEEFQREEVKAETEKPKNQSLDTLRGVSVDHKSDHDSAIGMNTPAQARQQLDRQVSQDSHTSHHSQHSQQSRHSQLSQPASPQNHQSQLSQSASPPQKPESKRPEFDENQPGKVTDPSHTHDHDVEHWVQEGRPLSSHQSSQFGMDYIRAGNHRLNRPPNLTRETMEDAKFVQQPSSDDDICARSPYSVD